MWRPSLRLPRMHGIQRRFFTALGMFVVASMTLLGTSLYLNQHQITLDRFDQDMRDQLQVLTDKGNAYSNFLARIAPQGILAHDYLLLESYVEELSSDPDVVYAVIMSRAQKPLTHFLKKTRDKPTPESGHAAVGPEQFPQALATVRADPSLLVVKRGILYNGDSLGTVEVALSKAKIGHNLAELKTNLNQELHRIALLTAGEILLALVLLILLIESAFHRLVIKPIQALGADMARAQAGDLSIRALDRDDEIGWLARSFNKMAADLQDHVNKIKETRDYLANILDNSADMIATTTLDGAIVEFNAAAERVLGYERAEIVAQSSRCLYSDAAERDRLYAAVRDGAPMQNAETRLTRKDGKIIDVELTLSPLRDNTGQLIGTVCIGRDNTHAKALRRELIQAEKMASVGQVAAWIAHQIRNSLGSILMGASALRPAETAEPGVHQAHRNLITAIAKLDRMVSDLLDYSRTLSLHPTPINLNAMIGDLLTTLTAGGLDSRIRIERVLAPDLPTIWVDVFKMEQAFGNVLRNAVQAMPQGGTLRVETRLGPGERQVTVVIEDNGIGIHAQDMPKVFMPFFSAKHGGTGLGLALTARIVEAHGGYVSVTSAIGHGAAFTFVLPYVAANEHAANKN